MKVDVQQIKQRFGIIGNNPGYNRAIDVALQVAQPTYLFLLQERVVSERRLSLKLFIRTVSVSMDNI